MTVPPTDATQEEDERLLTALSDDESVDIAIDRRAWRAIRVSGDDAARWLNDLLTAELTHLPAHGAARSLLLTPTGRIRADVHVYRRDDDFVIVQDPDQPRAIDDLLSPYLLSSAVDICQAAVGPICRPRGDGSIASAFRPSMLDRGVDVLVSPDEGDVFAPALKISERVVDIGRIRAGIPKFGVDMDEESLPAEAGLDDPTLGVIGASKGCYLGQESVAKVRNFGHPQRTLLKMRSEGAVSAGTAVSDGSREVGSVTSSTALPAGGEHALIVRVRWNARDATLTANGTPLHPA